MSKIGNMVIDSMNQQLLEKDNCEKCVHKEVRGTIVTKEKTQTNNWCRMKNISINNVTPRKECNTFVKRKELLCITCVNNQLALHGSDRDHYCKIHGHKISTGISDCNSYE